MTCHICICPCMRCPLLPLFDTCYHIRKFAGSPCPFLTTIYGDVWIFTTAIASFQDIDCKYFGFSFLGIIFRMSATCLMDMSFNQSMDPWQADRGPETLSEVDEEGVLVIN